MPTKQGDEQETCRRCLPPKKQAMFRQNRDVPVGIALVQQRPDMSVKLPSVPPRPDSVPVHSDPGYHYWWNYPQYPDYTPPPYSPVNYLSTPLLPPLCWPMYPTYPHWTSFLLSPVSLPSPTYSSDRISVVPVNPTSPAQPDPPGLKLLCEAATSEKAVFRPPQTLSSPLELLCNAAQHDDVKKRPAKRVSSAFSIQSILGPSVRQQRAASPMADLSQRIKEEPSTNTKHDDTPVLAEKVKLSKVLSPSSKKKLDLFTHRSQSSDPLVAISPDVEMNESEIEMRFQIADIQRQYRQCQKQLSQLKRKCDVSPKRSPSTGSSDEKKRRRSSRASSPQEPAIKSRLSEEKAVQEALPPAAPEAQRQEASECVPERVPSPPGQSSPARHSKDEASLSCVLNPEEIFDGLAILVMKEDVYYEGEVKAILPPDVFGIVLDTDKRFKARIVSQEQLLNSAMLDVTPSRVESGQRVCAYWSRRFDWLYPGRVRHHVNGNPRLVMVDFDDGDEGEIALDQIRLLPDDGHYQNLADDESLGLMSPRTRSSRHGSNHSRVPTTPEAKKSARPSPQGAEKAPPKEWALCGEGQMRGRWRKVYYPTIKRGAESLEVGDCAVFGTDSLCSKPYVGRIMDLFETLGGKKLVRVRWFYHPEEMKQPMQCGEEASTLSRVNSLHGCVYESAHEDDNTLDTISHKCRVHRSYDSYLAEKGDDESHFPSAFFLAGVYDHCTGKVTLQQDDESQTSADKQP